MEKEFLTTTTKTLTANVTANKVDSLRKVVNKTTTVRVYENGMIGVAGQEGDCDLAELEAQAVKNLKLNIAYPQNLSANSVKHVDDYVHIFDEKDFLHVCNHLLERLAKEEPDFLFSNKIYSDQTENTYSNTLGSDLSYRGNEFVVVLLIKDKDSVSIAELFFGEEFLSVDEDAVVNAVKTLCSTFKKSATIENGVYKVISSNGFISDCINHFVGEMYANGASLFNGKLGEKIFNDKVSYFKKQGYCSPFFDAEGECVTEDDCYLVKNGVFERVIANKKIASQFNLPRVPLSAAAYDGIPQVTANGLRFKVTADSVKDLIGSDKAIWVVDASGGDMTPSGEFATPVQTAFLVENGELVGRLPQLNVTGNVFDYLGDNFVGASEKGFYKTNTDQYIVTNMNVTLI